MGVARVLFLSDTHLGFDLPLRPRVERRRRGPDFFAAFERALEPARRGEVDLVVHGGDLFFRSRIPQRLAAMAFAPLLELAERGVPVLVVPGNHERSRIPHPLLLSHPLISVFDRPRTFSLRVKGLALAVAGFPYEPRAVRRRFPGVLESTGWRGVGADARLLCIHHCVEGASVGLGVSDYVFRSAEDVIRASDLPPGFAAVLSGHVHRAQVLTRDLRGRRLPVPVVYAGSIERTSFVERNETKGFWTLVIEGDATGRGRVRERRFHPLPTRPMVQIEVEAGAKSREHLEREIAALAEPQPGDAVLRIRVTGRARGPAVEALRSASLRALLPSSMTVSVWGEERGPG
jgi:exonuclease SbcD